MEILRRATKTYLKIQERVHKSQPLLKKLPSKIGTFSTEFFRHQYQPSAKVYHRILTVNAT